VEARKSKLKEENKKSIRKKLSRTRKRRKRKPALFESPNDEGHLVTIQKDNTLTRVTKKKQGETSTVEKEEKRSSKLRRSPSSEEKRGRRRNTK